MIRPLILSLVLLTGTALAQFVTITGTVDDPNGNPYQIGSGRATLVSGNGSGQQAWTVGGTNPVQTPIVINALDSFAKFSVQLANTSVIDQQSAQPEWQFCFAANQAIQPQVSFCMTPLALASSQDISGQIKAQSALLPGSIAPGTLPILNLVNVPGADWCARVNAGDAQLGSGGGEMWLTSAAGSSTTCSADAKISAGHVLRDVGCSTYALQGHSLLVSGDQYTASAVYGCGKWATVLTYTGSGSAVAPAVATNNLTRNVVLGGFSVSTGATACIGIDLHNAYNWYVYDTAVKGCSGTGGIGYRIRGDGTTPGPYFDKIYGSDSRDADTGLSISSDTHNNVATSWEVFHFSVNVATVGVDCAGQTGKFDDLYLENITSIGFWGESGCSNNKLEWVQVDNGSSGVGTGVQFDSGANDNRYNGNIFGMAANVTDNAFGNDFYGYNPILVNTAADGTFGIYNAADVDGQSFVRCGLTTNKNCGLRYVNWDHSVYWWAGQNSVGSYAIKSGQPNGTPVLTLLAPSAGGTNILDTTGNIFAFTFGAPLAYFGTTGSFTLGLNNYAAALTSSPSHCWDGSYQNSGTPTYAQDAWCVFNSIGSGTNGQSALFWSHAGTTGLLGFVLPSTTSFSWNTRSLLSSAVDGNIMLAKNANSDFGLLQFGGVSASYPALKRSTTTLGARLADDSGDAGFTALQLTSTVTVGTAPLVVTSTTPVANLTGQVLLYNHSGTQQTSAHCVQDSCVLGTSCSVTLTGASVFTSSTSYTVACVDGSAIDACSVAQSSGSAFAITGNSTDTIRYLACGN